MTSHARAYSYVRFSTPEQLKGDSLRRQTEAAADWCSRNNVALDTSTTFRDLGKSAYTGTHRSNPDRHALALFLKLVESSKVPEGSYLLIENLDRLSREETVPAAHLLTGILLAGVNVVQLSPAELVLTAKADAFDIMRAVMELSRGHGESVIKSKRVGAAWKERRRAMREEGAVLTRRLPAWIEEKGGRLRLIPGRAAAIRRIYQLTAAGYGLATTIRKLIEEKVPPFGPSGHWARSYIALLLSDRRVMGEFQPRCHGAADGAPIADYYPAAVSEADWLAARAAVGLRRRIPGRVGKHANIFTRLLFDARDGGTYQAATHLGRGKVRYRVLVNARATCGLDKFRAFPFQTFEAAILSLLREIDPHEILNGDAGPDEALTLAGELANVEAKIAELEAELLQGDVAALARVLRNLESTKTELVEKLSEAREKAAHPLSVAWGETQSLAASLNSAPDPVDARLRLRRTLRQIVEGIWILVVRRGHDRLCAAQVWFGGGKKHRDYLILHRPPKANRRKRTEGGWRACSLASIPKTGQLDLRRRKDAAALEKLLAAVDIEDLLAAMPGGPGLNRTGEQA
jgi:DNA invertase Pin-like site-specific DNA recombinase